MRIILGIGNYSHGYGMPNVVHNLAKELLDQGNDVLVLAGKGNLNDDVPLIKCGYNETLKHAYITKVTKKIFDLKPDIFHSHYYPMDFCGAITSSRITHVMHVHGILKREYWTNMKATLECIRSSFSEAVGIKFSAKVIAISRYLKSDILRKYKIDPEKIEVIYPSINLELYSPEKRSSLPRVFPNSEGITLLSTGAISERKGQHLLVDVMKEVVEEEPMTRLYLFGRTGQEDVSYLYKLQNKIKKYCLEKNIFIKGFMETKFLPNAYAQADIFVTGTMWEGFGMPLAEAMASGIPVIAFNTAAMDELIVNKVNGLKVSPFNTKIFSEMVLSLIQNSRLRKELSENARDFAESKFGIQKNICHLLDIYNSLT
ncbi:MAG: glycosyltransferase family 1 protein [Dehalococcoidia bacterium]|nr:MAG: glycosyltransferase family 1 protein [Dehalococcoidia bacterium]